MSTSPLAKKPKLDEHSNALESMLNPAPLQDNSSETQHLPSIATMASAANGAAPAPAIPPLLVKKLSDKARAPTRGSAYAAGYDIYSAHSTMVPARGKALVDTDIAIAVPAGTYGRVAPRSGLASKHSIDVGAGVIDADYRGQVKVLLFNLSDQDFEVQEGERVAQLVLERIWTPEVVVVEELEQSVRGAGGFGSTGGFGGDVLGSGGGPAGGLTHEYFKTPHGKKELWEAFARDPWRPDRD